MTSSRRVQGLLSVLTAGVMLAVGCSKSSESKPTSSSSGSNAPGTSTASQADSGPPVTVSAEQLGKDFKNDPAAADKKYKDHTLIIEGKVHDVYNIAGKTSLILWGYREKDLDVPKLVQCFFPPEKDKEIEAYKDKKGEKVKVEGKGAGSIDTINYQVLDCKLVK